MRPSTEGCTEWSCPYHGDLNRKKAEHAEGCAVRAFTGHDLSVPECTCSKLGKEAR